jgi:hypothetical protein
VTWLLSSSSDPRALAVVDGVRADLFTPPELAVGPHYSRQTPGSKTFTGIGQEIVLVSSCGRAVWSVVRQLPPAPRGTPRTGAIPDGVPFVWRNNVFRNLGAGLSSSLITAALIVTYREWMARYGELPAERMRTEIDLRKVRSSNPGCCYQHAGWERGVRHAGKITWWEPLDLRPLVENPQCPGCRQLMAWVEDDEDHGWECRACHIVAAA